MAVKPRKEIDVQLLENFQIRSFQQLYWALIWDKINVLYLLSKSENPS